MAVIGPQGKDVPDVRADGVNEVDYYEIMSRLHTDYDREPFQREYGIGVEGAIGNPTLPASEIRRRIEASLASAPFEFEEAEVQVTIGSLRINLDLRGRRPS